MQNSSALISCSQPCWCPSGSAPNPTMKIGFFKKKKKFPTILGLTNHSTINGTLKVIRFSGQLIIDRDPWLREVSGQWRLGSLGTGKLTSCYSTIMTVLGAKFRKGRDHRYIPALKQTCSSLWTDFAVCLRVKKRLLICCLQKRSDILTSSPFHMKRLHKGSCQCLCSFLWPQSIKKTAFVAKIQLKLQH